MSAHFDDAALMAKPAAEIAQLRSRSLAFGAAGLVAVLAGWFMTPGSFWQSYLIAFMFWIGITLGSMAVLMVQYLSGGAWGLVARRILEASTKTLPLMAVLFIPIYLQRETLYPWARPEAVNDAIIQTKAAYLNSNFFAL